MNLFSDVYDVVQGLVWCKVGWLLPNPPQAKKTTDLFNITLWGKNIPSSKSTKNLAAEIITSNERVL